MMKKNSRELMLGTVCEKIYVCNTRIQITLIFETLSYNFKVIDEELSIILIYFFIYIDKSHILNYRYYASNWTGKIVTLPIPHNDYPQAFNIHPIKQSQ